VTFGISKIGSCQGHPELCNGVHFQDVTMTCKFDCCLASTADPSAIMLVSIVG